MIAKYTKEELVAMQHTHLVHAYIELQKQIFESKKPEKNSENSSVPPSKNPLNHKKPENTTREVS
jgi:hypothetical protein